MNPISKDRPVSSQTFGPQEGNTQLHVPTPVVATRSRAPSMRREPSPSVETRPTLIRAQTPNVAENQAEIADMFASNMFADPVPQKMFGKFGSKLLTDGHQRLIMLLREECGRLYSFNRTLKQRINYLERSTRNLEEQVRDMRTTLHHKSERLATVTSELREAHDTIREMDDDMERSRSKRLSRIGQYGDLSTLNVGEYAS